MLYGLGMPELNDATPISLSECYRREQRHSDALNIRRAFSEYLHFPTTFDGSLPSETIAGRQARVVIGGTYLFEDVGDGGTVAKVTSATVNEQEKAAYIGVTTREGQGQILRQPMSDEELADYKAHSAGYFGEVQPEQKLRNTPYELFEWFMETHKEYPREYFLKQLAGVPNLEEIKALSDDDLRLHYCEVAVSSIWNQRPVRE
jgi:hypothetical protein